MRTDAHGSGLGSRTPSHSRLGAGETIIVYRVIAFRGRMGPFFVSDWEEAGSVRSHDASQHVKREKDEENERNPRKEPTDVDWFF